MEINAGWIKIHRKIIEWEWYDDANTFRVFMHLLLTANREPKKWHGQVIEVGEVVIGTIELAETLRMGRQALRSALIHLKSTNELTIKTTSQFTLIKLNNWERYQVYGQQNNQRVTNEQPTDNQQITTTKEYKEIKNLRNTITQGEGSISWLRAIPEPDERELMAKYRISASTLHACAEDVIDYCEAKGKTYKNYKAALRNFIKSEIERHPEIVLAPVKVQPVSIPRTDEEQAKINEKLQKVRESLAQKLKI